jgi:hypothetical protein
VLISNLSEGTLLYPIDLVGNAEGLRHVKARFWLHEKDLMDVNTDAQTARIATTDRSVSMDRPNGYLACTGGYSYGAHLQGASFGQPVGIVGGPAEAGWGEGDCGSVYRVELWGWILEDDIGPP